MKKLTEILALVLAGLLCVTVLLACADTVFTSDDDEDDEDEDSIDFSDYKKLTPEKVWDKLTDAEYVKISLETFEGDETVITRNGDSVKLSAHGELTYFDYKNALCYVADEDDTFIAEELTDEWVDLLESEVAGFFAEQSLEFFLESDWYDDSGRVYSATEETLDNLDLECDTVSAYMTAKKTTYTFTCEMEKDGLEASAICEVEFDEFSVKLPEADGINIDTNAPTTRPLPNTTTKPANTDKPETQAPPVTAAPPVTTVPSVTQAPPVTTVPPDVNVPDIPANAKTPYQLFNETILATDATVRLKYKADDGLTYQYVFEKDGDIILWQETNSGIDYYNNYYYDNAANRQYYLESDGNWYYVKDYLDWADLLSSIDSVMLNVLTMSDGCFEYDASADSVKLSQAYCDQLDIRGAAVSLNSAGTQYTFSIVHNDFSTSTFSVKFSVFTLRLPAGAQPAPDEPSTSDPTETTYYAPSQIYDALMNSEDVYFEAFNGSQYAIYRKDGHLISTSVGDTKEDMTTVYVDTENGIGYYYSNGQWLSAPYEANWESMMAQAGLYSDTYLFVDSYFNSFDADDGRLTFKSEMMNDPNAVIELIRDENGYTYNIYNATASSYFYFCFENVTITLPN